MADPFDLALDVAAFSVGQGNDTTGHLQNILAQISSFCLVIISIFAVFEILIFCLAQHCSYHDVASPKPIGDPSVIAASGLDNILVLLIGDIPVTTPTVLSVTLAVGAQQLVKYEAIVTCITTFEELAVVTILCSDETGTLTANGVTIDRPSSLEDFIKLAAHVSRTENQDTIDTCIVGFVPNPSKAHTDIKILDFKPFDPFDKRTEVACREGSTSKPKRVTKGMTGIIVEFCNRGG